MIVDTSAVMVLLLDEPERSAFLDILQQARIRRFSAGSLIELAVVVQRRDIASPDALDALLDALALVIEPVTDAQARLATAAYRRYGRGTGHPAALNFGDCFAYALAKAMDEPLLYKGADFGLTDVISAPGSAQP